MKDLLWTRREDWLFIIPATLVWIVALIVTGWDFVVLQNAVFRFGFVSGVGALGMVTGVAIRRMARRALGKQFSYALKIVERHELITRGVYRYVRHPAYTGDLLFQLGLALLFSSSYGFLLMLALVPLMLYRIRIEERMMIEKFGDAYQEYRRKTKALIPFVY